MTALQVTEVNITVNDIYIAAGDDDQTAEPRMQ